MNQLLLLKNSSGRSGSWLITNTIFIRWPFWLEITCDCVAEMEDCGTHGRPPAEFNPPRQIRSISADLLALSSSILGAKLKTRCLPHLSNWLPFLFLIICLWLLHFSHYSTAKELLIIKESPAASHLLQIGKKLVKNWSKYGQKLVKNWSKIDLIIRLITIKNLI